MKTPSDLRIPFTWSERRSVLLDQCLYIPDNYDKHGEWQKIPWASLFNNENPIMIEYCSGNGQWICEKAKQNPSVNWVAVEKRLDRASKIWARLHREGLYNLFVVCGEAVIFTRFYIPPHSVTKIFVNFPDPWPKLRHAKHRLIREEFLDQLDQVMTPSAQAIFTTDDRVYLGQMLEVLSLRPQWQSKFPDPYFVNEWPNFGVSYFSNLWKQKGRPIYHLHFELIL